MGCEIDGAEAEAFLESNDPRLTPVAWEGRRSERHAGTTAEALGCY